MVSDERRVAFEAREVLAQMNLRDKITNFLHGTVGLEPIADELRL